nr:hypothetical protein L204_03821 [Cryptococcus depauperatus CBS 7855]
MPEPFGSFGWICSHTVLPQCNLFFSQLFHDPRPYVTTLFPDSSEFFTRYNVSSSSSSEDPVVLAAKSDAGTGIGSNCQIARVGHRGSSGDIALIVLSAISLFTAFFLAFRATRRWAAVGRTELRLLLVAYGIHSGLQLVTMTSLLEQGSKGLAVVSAIHVAVIVLTFWLLLGNALIATQVVEDGTAAALVPLIVIGILFFVSTLYISLDTAFHWTNALNMSAGDVKHLKATALFVLTLIVPAAFAVLYLLFMLYIVISVLNEVKPACETFHLCKAITHLYPSFVRWLLRFIRRSTAGILSCVKPSLQCEHLSPSAAMSDPAQSSHGKVNSAFIATLLEIMSVGMLYLAWVSITEDDWAADEYGMY